MAVDYDLIIIGGSPAGTYAAIAAAKLKARVALVETEPSQSDWQGYSAIAQQTFTQLGRVAQQVKNAPQFGIYQAHRDSPPQQSSLFVQWTEARQWAQAVVSNCSEQRSPAILGSLGIDVILGRGEFCRRPYLGFVVNNRRLRSRAYLIATGFRLTIPEIEGLQRVGYLTPTDLWQDGLNVGNFNESDTLHPSPQTQANTPGRQLPKNWVVIGGNPMSIELAQTLIRLECEVTLVVSTPQILPTEDSEVSRLIQAQLEAEGIRILTQSPVTHVRRIDEKKWVQAGNQAIEADEILLTTQQPKLESLNLEGVGVQFQKQGLVLNEKLQTTNPRIYACGGSSGAWSSHVSQYESRLILRNALFLPLFKVDYQRIPRVIFSDPQVARVGLTEAQAIHRYGKAVFVVRQYFKSLDQAQILGETTGFCKLLVRRNGEILGASLVGPGASELIGAIALLVQQKLKVNAIAQLPHASPTLSEIIQKTALEWQRQRLERNQTFGTFLESFFNLRRRWSS